MNHRMCYPFQYENNRCSPTHPYPIDGTPNAGGYGRPKRRIAGRCGSDLGNQPGHDLRLAGSLPSRRLGTARCQETGRPAEQTRRPGLGLDLQSRAEGPASVQVQVRAVDECYGSGDHPASVRRLFEPLFGLPSYGPDGPVGATSSPARLSAGPPEGRALAEDRVPGDPAASPEKEGGYLVCRRGGRPFERSCGDDLGAPRTNADRVDDGGSIQGQLDLGGEPAGRFSVHGRRRTGHGQGVHRVPETAAGSCSPRCLPDRGRPSDAQSRHGPEVRRDGVRQVASVFPSALFAGAESGRVGLERPEEQRDWTDADRNQRCNETRHPVSPEIASEITPAHPIVLPRSDHGLCSLSPYYYWRISMSEAFNRYNYLHFFITISI